MSTTITISGASSHANIILDSSGGSIVSNASAAAAAETPFLGIPFYDGSSATGLVSDYVTAIEYFTFPSDASANACAIAFAPSSEVTGLLRFELYVQDNIVHCIRTFENWSYFSAAEDDAANLPPVLKQLGLQRLHCEVIVKESDVEKTYKKVWNTPFRAFASSPDSSNIVLTLDVYAYAGGYRQKLPTNSPKFDPSGYLVDPSGSFSCTEIFTCASPEQAKAHCNALNAMALQSVGQPNQPKVWELALKGNVCYCYQIYESNEEFIASRNQFTAMGYAGILEMLGSTLLTVLTLEINSYTTPAMQTQINTAWNTFLAEVRKPAAVTAGFPIYIVNFNGHLGNGGAIYSYN